MLKVLILVLAQFCGWTNQMPSKTDLYWIMDHLSLESPIIFGNLNQTRMFRGLVKDLSKKDNYMQVTNSFDILALKSHIIKESGIWLDYQNLDPVKTALTEVIDNDSRIGAAMPFLVLITDIQDMDGFSLMIDQNVFFLTESTLDLYECYEIANRRIVNHFGHFNSTKQAFVIESDTDSNPGKPGDFLARRSNFYKLEMKVATDFFAPFILIKDGYRDADNKISEVVPDTYEVTGMVSGMFHDILTVIQQELNFTVRYFNRLDEAWGSFDSDSNEWSGMVGSLVKGEIDMINTGLTQTMERSTVVDFLPPLSADIYAIVIKDPDAQATSWVTFILILSKDLWIAMLVVAFSMAVFKAVIFTLRKQAEV